MDFSETIVVYDIKVGKCSLLKWVHEALWVPTVKVIQDPEETTYLGWVNTTLPHANTRPHCNCVVIDLFWLALSTITDRECLVKGLNRVSTFDTPNRHFCENNKHIDKHIIKHFIASYNILSIPRVEFQAFCMKLLGMTPHYVGLIVALSAWSIGCFRKLINIL